MKQYQLLYPTVELENLGMGKDYVSLTYIKSKSKQICISHRGKLC